jgi:hypothetical protein
LTGFLSNPPDIQLSEHPAALREMWYQILADTQPLVNRCVHFARKLVSSKLNFF